MFIGIYRRVGDLSDKSAYKGLPDSYPVECEQLLGLSEVDAFLIKHPGAEVMTVEQYKGLEKGLEMLHEQAKTIKPGFFKRLFGV